MCVRVGHWPRVVTVTIAHLSGHWTRTIQVTGTSTRTHAWPILALERSTGRVMTRIAVRFILWVSPRTDRKQSLQRCARIVSQADLSQIRMFKTPPLKSEKKKFIKYFPCLRLMNTSFLDEWIHCLLRCLYWSPWTRSTMSLSLKLKWA